MSVLYLKDCQLEIDPIQVNEWKTVDYIDVPWVWLNMKQVVWSFINSNHDSATCHLPDGKSLTTYDPKSILDITNWLLENAKNLEE